MLGGSYRTPQHKGISLMAIISYFFLLNSFLNPKYIKYTIWYKMNILTIAPNTNPMNSAKNIMSIIK